MKKTPLMTLGALTLGALIPSLHADQVILDDLIVDGSAAVGMDAVNGESFGFDTIRLKENNLRIHFDDTSNSASFPSNDWRLVANETSNGGANKFSIEDATAGRSPFTIEAGASKNALYVDDAGRVGLGTATPVVELHIPDGDTPTVRLEQDGTSGFTPQTWDMAGNEANFFVRDVTNGSTLSFRIRPSSPESSVDIHPSGVGIRNTNPSANLHVNGTTIETLLVAADNAEANKMTFKGDGEFSVETATNKFLYTNAGLLELTRGSVLGSTTTLSLDETGNLTIGGTLMEMSDVNRKENIAEVDGSSILEKLAELPIKKWSYKGESVTHIGPMAQDFWKSFQLGPHERGICSVDANGVAIASIQALYQQVKEKDFEIKRLSKQNDSLEQRLERLEKLMKRSLQ